MENNDRTNIRPFGIKDKVGYMLGDLGNDCTFIMIAFFLQVFYIKVLGLSGTVVGILFLTARLFDAFTDVAMGRLIDKLKPAKEGRFRVWIKRVSPIVTMLGAMCFLFIVKDWPYTAKVIYVFITYILWGSFAYTAINIPYGSMATVITDDSKQRAELSIFRSMGAAIAQITIGFLVPMIVYTKSASGEQLVVPEKFTMIAAGFAILGFICYQICYAFSVERTQIQYVEKKEHEPVLQEIRFLFKSLGQNKALLSLVLAALVLLTTMLLQGTMNAYLYIDYFKDKASLGIASSSAAIITLVLAPFSGSLIGKFGKKETSVVALLYSGVMYLLIFALKGVIGTNSIMFLTLIIMSNFGIGFFNMAVWAFLTDIIDNHEVETNERQDGTIYAVYSFARKLGQALAGGLGGFALTFIGYDTAKNAVQTPQVKDNLYNFFTLSSGIGFLAVGLIILFLYPLSKKVVEENTRILQEKRAKLAK